MALIEKGLIVTPTIVDPWADDPRLRAANVAARVPTLILDSNIPLTESLLIVMWLEATRPSPQWPTLIGKTTAETEAILSRAGVALGAIDASVHTIITRKVTAPALFDETPVGLKRRRTMIEGLERIESIIPAIVATHHQTGALQLDAICAITLFDYQQFRYSDQPWLPTTPALKGFAEQMRGRPAVADTMPR